MSLTYIEIECNQIAVWEGNEPFLYLDSDNPPNATTGQGYLVANLAVSKTLPWKTPTGSAATSSQIASDWARVFSLPGDHEALYYKSASGLVLLQSDINAITLEQVTVVDNALRKAFAHYDNFPTSAKVGLLDMGYNLGVEKLLDTYPEFCIAVRSQNWAAAAKECIRNANMKAFEARNSWTVTQFIQAKS